MAADLVPEADAVAADHVPEADAVAADYVLPVRFAHVV